MKSGTTYRRNRIGAYQCVDTLPICKRLARPIPSTAITGQQAGKESGLQVNLTRRIANRNLSPGLIPSGSASPGCMRTREVPQALIGPAFSVKLELRKVAQAYAIGQALRVALSIRPVIGRGNISSPNGPKFQSGAKRKRRSGQLKPCKIHLLERICCSRASASPSSHQARITGCFQRCVDDLLLLMVKPG